jgi:hypothetical protein
MTEATVSIAERQALLSMLHSLSETAPAVTKAIFSHVRPNTNALRGTNQLLRATVNRTVSTVSLIVPSRTREAASSLDMPAQLGIAFPNATKLNLDIALHPIGVRSLAHLAKACPRLVAGLQAIHMKLHDSFLHQPSVAALSSFLAR